MSCYYPMLAVKTGRVNIKSGKEEYKFLKSLRNWSVNDDMRDFGEPQWYQYSDKLIGSTGNLLVDELTGEVLNRAVVLPCGQCLGCRTAYAAQWANRILLEQQYHDKSYFITLTYDEEHVPIHETKNGEKVLSLEPDDLQLFIKRLRRQQSYHQDNKIRFYAVGEYGSQFHRPHYHIIVFGLLLDDIREIGKNKSGRMLHSSDTIEKLWSYGRVEVDELTWELAAYAARYTVKKLGKKETGFYEEQNLVPEFTRMSLKPAIGAQYFEDHIKDIYDADEIVIPTASGARHVKPPRYYDMKYDDVYPYQMEKIKGNRKELAKQMVMLKLDRFSGTYLELLHNEEVVFKQRTKSLRRTLE